MWELELLQLAFSYVVDGYAQVAEGADGAFHVAADGGFSAGGGFVGFFDGDDATVGPGALRDGGHGFAELIEAEVELLTACAGGTEDAAGAEVAGVGVGL